MVGSDCEPPGLDFVFLVSIGTLAAAGRERIREFPSGDYLFAWRCLVEEGLRREPLLFDTLPSSLPFRSLPILCLSSYINIVGCFPPVRSRLLSL